MSREIGAYSSTGAARGSAGIASRDGLPLTPLDDTTEMALRGIDIGGIDIEKMSVWLWRCVARRR